MISFSLSCLAFPLPLQALQLVLVSTCFLTKVLVAVIGKLYTAYLTLNRDTLLLHNNDNFLYMSVICTIIGSDLCVSAYPDLQVQD